jgi:hypothetical protein
VIHNNELRSHERHEQWRLSGGGGGREDCLIDEESVTGLEEISVRVLGKFPRLIDGRG